MEVLHMVCDMGGDGLCCILGPIGCMIHVGSAS